MLKVPSFALYVVNRLLCFDESQFPIAPALVGSVNFCRAGLL